MSSKPETRFRTNTVRPFLKTLKNSVFFPIQQLAIHDDADFFGCCRGRFVALELKADDGEVRPLQQHKLDEVKRTHGVSLVASPKTWAKARALLLKLDNGEDEYD